MKLGDKCNYLTIITDKNKYINGSTYHLCQCVCGNKKYVADNVFRYKHIQDCGCGKFALDKAKLDYIGKKYNMLTILDCYYDFYQGTRRTFAKCKCDCGNIKGYNLTEIKKGHIKSCGCLVKFNFDRDYKYKVFNGIQVLSLIDKNKKIVECKCHCGEIFVTYLINLLKKTRYIIACPHCHNGKTPKYNIKEAQELNNGDIKSVFYSMKSRCYNINNKSYQWYGGKGIKICDEWINDTNKFVEWALSNGYKKGLTIDRIDNGKDYSPENCRWVNMIVQNNNKDFQKYLYKDEYLSIAEISRRVNINYRTLLSRIKTQNLSVEEAINKPIINRG